MLLFGDSHIGKRRKMNQDAFFCDPIHGFWIIADGVGGLQAGQVAAHMAVEEITKYLQKKPTLPEKLLQSVEATNRSIYQAGIKNLDWTGMATTLNVVVVEGKSLHIINVGDSRTYLLRNGQLEQMTLDHNIKTFLAKGWIQPNQVDDRISKESLLRVLGMDSPCQPDLTTVSWENGDLWMTVTDGLYGMVSESEIIDILLAERGNLKKAIDTLIAKANEQGGRDNITVILADFS
jgi:serine/threonine protein phosphatase PrpC